LSSPAMALSQSSALSPIFLCLDIKHIWYDLTMSAQVTSVSLCPSFLSIIVLGLLAGCATPVEVRPEPLERRVEVRLGGLIESTVTCLDNQVHPSIGMMMKDILPKIKAALDEQLPPAMVTGAGQEKWVMELGIIKFQDVGSLGFDLVWECRVNLKINGTQVDSITEKGRGSISRYSGEGAWADFMYKMCHKEASSMIDDVNANRTSIESRIAGVAFTGAGGGVMSRQGGTAKINVAVSDLAAEGVSQSDSAIVADWLRGALVSSGAFTVVERGAMQKVLSEQAFQQTGCTSSECAVRVGKVLNVQRMIVGSFGKFLDSYVLNVRVVDVESGEVIYSDSAKGKTTDEVEVNIKGLAQRLSR